jgi:hypothetical protein
MNHSSRLLPEVIDQLGTPLAVRRARTFLLLFELFLGGVWFFICLAPTLFAVGIILASSVKAQVVGFGAGLLLFVIFGPLTFLGVKIMLRAWRGLGVRLLVMPTGIIYTRWRLVVVYRWEEIFAFSYWAIDHVKDDAYLDSLYYYRFRHRDGHRFIFAERLDRNAEKPIAQFVEEGLINCQLPLLRQRFLQQNEEVFFGPFTLSLNGLYYKRLLLPWPEVDFIWSEDGRVRVRKKGKILNWCSVKLIKVPNCCLFLALAKERLSQEESQE